MPKQRDIAAALREEIEDGRFPEGRMLPTEERLTQRFPASRQTVRKALSALAGEGLVSKLRGSGSRVRALP